MSEEIRIGYKADGELRTYKGDGHLLSVAPTRSGKGRDLLIPALMTYEGSALVVDPKGQLLAVTGQQRVNMGQNVYVINPFKIWQDFIGHLPHVTFNPMMTLDRAADSFATDCDSMAEAIVLQDVGDGEKYWTNSARQLISGLIMRLASGPFGSEANNLLSVYKLLSSPSLFEFIQAAVKEGDALIEGRLGRFAAADAGQQTSIQGIISTAITECGFMGNKAIYNSLKSAAPGSYELRFRDMRRQKMTVYVVLPTRYLGTCSKWFRLIVQAALSDLLQEDEKGVPVLMMLDEFAQLKRLSIIENAMAGAAGYGIQLWCVVQDLNQLKGIYGADGWETFLSNSAIRTFFAPYDKTTSDYVSDMCGETEIGFLDKTVGEQPVHIYQEAVDKSLNVGLHWQRVARKLMHPLEVRQLGRDEMLIFAAGVGNVIRGKRLSYLETPEFKDRKGRPLYGADPYHVTRAKV